MREYQQYCFKRHAATPVPSFHGEQAGLADSARTSQGTGVFGFRVLSAGRSWGSRWALSGAAGGRASLTGPISEWRADGGKYTSSVIRAGTTRPPCPHIERRTPT